MGVKPIGDKPLRMDKRKTSAKRGEGSDFQDILEKGAHESRAQKIKSLFDAIEDAAGDLSVTPGDVSLKEYRRRIKAFMNEVLSGTREVKVIQRSGILEDPLVIVKIIDEKLDRLTQIVISEEVERGEMAKIIEDIKGILVDLYR